MFLKLVKSDLKALCGKENFCSFLKWYFLPKGSTFRYTFWLRLLQSQKKHVITKIILVPFTYLIFRHYEYKYGIHCDSNIKIGFGFKIVHGDCVYINAKSIGNNVTIYQNVTIGVDKNGGKPLICNNVTIYPGSVVTGDIVLNVNSVIGCNSYVHKTIEKNSIVVGCPAKKIGESD